MAGRIALRPFLRVLCGARKGNTWADFTRLLKDRLFRRRSAAKNQDPLPPLLFELATGYWLSQAIYVVATLGIADLLEDGPQSSAELAAATRCDPLSLCRVLRALSSVGIVSHVNHDCYTLTRLGDALRSNDCGSLRRILITLGEIHYQACCELLHTVRTGSPAFNPVFGASLFEHLQRNPQDGITFNEGMSDLASLLAHAVLLAYDFSELSCIVDVGEGEGQFVRSILELYPGVTGIVFDNSNKTCELQQ
jgi:hypothetical protein